MRSTTSVRRTLLHPTVTYPHYSCLVSTNTTTDFPERLGCGSSVVKVSDHCRHVMSWSPGALKTHRAGQRCTLNLSRAETSSRWCGEVVRRGGCQLTSLDHGSKLRGPSPKAFV
ncbi:uncharacterized protein TNCV_4702211 [Trichonephila clavipes]|nr:uncharacterized protein TNCV_4702211 [Trichonephila clavipes]